MPRPKALALLLLAAASLSGCAQVQAAFGIIPSQDFTECPEFGRLKDADRLIRFIGAPGDPATVLFEASIVDVAAVCDYDDDAVDVTAGMRVQVEPGPAWNGGAMPVEVVIAHTSGERDVLRRFRGALEITPDETGLSGFQDYTVEYELPFFELSDLADDKIAMGLRLSRAELRYIRSLRAR